MDAQRHDKAYRLLFSDPYFVRQLLTTFVKEPWIEEVELDRIEPLQSVLVDTRLLRFECGLPFRVRFRGREAYLIVLLELQATPERYMAVRLLVYQCLLWLSLLEREPGRRDLPPVFPLVLYRGEQPWNAPRRLEELVAPEGDAAAAYVPRFAYHVVDEGRYSREHLLALENLIGAVFLFEGTSRENLAAHLELIGRWIKQVLATDPASAAHFMKWVRVRFSPDARSAEEVWAEDVQDPREWQQMLDRTIEELKDEGRREGWQEGEAKGRQEGSLEARRELAIKLRARGITVVEVAELTGLPEDEVRGLGQ